MEFLVDEDVQATAEFMIRNVPAHKLAGVADGLAKLAGLLWSSVPQESVNVVSLISLSLARDSRTRSAASESCLAQ